MYFREPPPKCKNLSLINDGKCDLAIFNEECQFDGNDCCSNTTAIGNGYCDIQNLNMICNYDGGDCCNLEKVEDGKCDPFHFNRMCEPNREWNDCSCDYANLTRDGYCNVANNKTNCLFDDFDCLCPNATLIDGMYIDCEGSIVILLIKY